MAHNIEQMFSVRQVPWHGLGHIVKQAPSAEEAIKLAGLDWKVVEHPISFATANGLDINYTPIANYNALVRSDNNTVLSVMKDSYTPLQNEKAFSFFNPFVDSGLASFETAGSLRKGRVIWILATLNKAPIEVGKGDEVNKYLLLSNSHDGTLSVRVGFTPIRVVCNNTLTAALGADTSRILKIRHSAKVADRLDQIQEIVNAMDAKFEASAEQYKALSKSDVSAKELEKYIDIIFKLTPSGTEREQLRAKKMRETITNLFENGAGQHLKTAKGTYWGAYNAISEYLTHESSKEQDSRLYGNWFGDKMRMNREAFELALHGAK